MRDLAEIGTVSHPLHCSALANLLRCPWRIALIYLNEPEDVSGPAANTGSATHAAIAAWHHGKGADGAVEEMCERISEYPLADLADAARLFLAYTQDPRNYPEATVLCEQKVAFSLAPDPSDPTGAPICIVGRLDQVREVDGVLRMYDIKTSTREGIVLLAEHMFQAAAYCVGASMYLQRRVEPGALICPRKYFRRGVDPRTAPTGVFWHFAWTYDDIDIMLGGIRRAVAAVRSGNVHFNPGDYCQWCPAKTPDLCIPLYKETFNASRRNV